MDNLEVSLALKEDVLEILDTTGDIILDNQIIPFSVLRNRQKTNFPQEIKKSVFHGSDLCV